MEFYQTVQMLNENLELVVMGLYLPGGSVDNVERDLNTTRRIQLDRLYKMRQLERDGSRPKTHLGTATAPHLILTCLKFLPTNH